MNIFDTIIEEVERYKLEKRQGSQYREFRAEATRSWPRGGPRDLILMPDLSVEFGSPENASVSFALWTANEALVTDGRITLVGPDAGETGEMKNPFGKVVVAGVKGFDETNAYNRNRELHLKKFDLALKGHMLRSASHYLAEWNRISKDAVGAGFSFSHLGGALIGEYRKLAYVTSVEVLFVTSSDADVTRLYDPGRRSARMIEALSKMVREMDVDCSGCEYRDLCNEAGGLRRLRAELAQKRGGHDL